MNSAFVLVLFLVYAQTCHGFLPLQNIRDIYTDLHRSHGNGLDLSRRQARTTSSPSATTDSKFREVCYEAVGCFNNSDPFVNLDGVLPDQPERVGTHFRLYTRRFHNGTSYEFLSYLPRDPSVTTTAFNSNAKTRVIVHGFKNTGDQDWMQNMKDAFLKMADENVIVVDWGPGANVGYGLAVANTRLVGRQIRVLLERLMREAGLSLDNVHLIGHSLGAHTSGYVGRQLGGKIYRITGMDPAGPQFEGFTNAVLFLDKTDAQFVDNIHTNGKNILQGGAGMVTATAHVDFYVNGGGGQPGCTDGLWSLISGGFAAAGCSHGRSHDLFVESITTECAFTAYPCPNDDEFQEGRCLDCEPGGCTELGLYADQHPARGNRYLNTRSKPPYCGFHYRVTIHAGAGKNTTGQIQVTLSGAWGTSGYVQITEEKENLYTGVQYSGVMVSSVEVGRIRRLTMRYDRYEGITWLFHAGQGQDRFPVEAVDIMSGENGKVYRFCPQQTHLLHGQDTVLEFSETGSCS